ncbi:hypothetical protein Dsin_014561 [Dipteronia sinensis]|uniref:Uncharacterized protein n=1 Tax=Dipteronia sinensis TaxID=43782 RepID=A0AAE0AM76_9ROSI|nr:hypothetical protein Dsin_014561 [Dipteronia sinensis]
MGGVGKKKSTCNDIEYFVFGLFTDIRYRNDKEKFSFIRKQIKDLEDDGKTKVKFFTLVDATDSTREADNFLKKHFGELDNTKIICEFRVVPCYNDEGDKHLEADLANFRKRMLDCYSACCFSWHYFKKCLLSQLMAGKEGRETIEILVGYAEETLGYVMQPGKYRTFPLRLQVP